MKVIVTTTYGTVIAFLHAYGTVIAQLYAYMAMSESKWKGVLNDPAPVSVKVVDKCSGDEKISNIHLKTGLNLESQTQNRFQANTCTSFNSPWQEFLDPLEHENPNKIHAQMIWIEVGVLGFKKKFCSFVVLTSSLLKHLFIEAISDRIAVRQGKDMKGKFSEVKRWGFERSRADIRLMQPRKIWKRAIMKTLLFCLKLFCLLAVGWVRFNTDYFYMGVKKWCPWGPGALCSRATWCSFHNESPVFPK